MSIEGASVCIFVPSADMMTRRRNPPRLTMTTTRCPSGDTAAGSDSGISAALTTSDACPSLKRHKLSPTPPVAR